MDLAEICRVMGRRWYILLPGLLLTAVLVAGAALKVPVTYHSQSTVMLLNSEKATRAYDGNPFLSSQVSLTGMADLLARNLNSDESVAALRSAGATGTAAAKLADNAQGPMLWLTVTGTDKAAVVKSDRLLTSYADKRLGELQSQQSVASQAAIRMIVIVPPQHPVAETKTRLEYLVLAGVAGLVVTMVATFYIEARFRRPAGRRAAGREPAADAEGSPEQEAAAEPSGRAAARAARKRAPRWSRDSDDRQTGDDPDDPAADRSAAGSGDSSGDTNEAPVPTESDTHRFV